MQRRYRLQSNDTPDSLTLRGGGKKQELYAANRAWLGSDFQPWNPGQQMNIPDNWNTIPGEYAVQ